VRGGHSNKILQLQRNVVVEPRGEGGEDKIKKKEGVAANFTEFGQGTVRGGTCKKKKILAEGK